MWFFWFFLVFHATDDPDPDPANNDPDPDRNLAQTEILATNTVI
jgi:hypothetical protein